MKLSRVNENGMFIEDVIVNEKPNNMENLIEIPCPEGFYHPKWNGTEWTEGLTQAEIDAIKNVIIEQPLELRNRADIDYISIMVGVNL